MKNLVILVTVMLTWFCFGFAVAFGVNNRAGDIQFGGFFYGWFGDMSGGLSTDPALNGTLSSQPLTEVSSTITQEEYVPQEIFNMATTFSQRKFFVFFCYMTLASNIATSSIAERCHLKPIIAFVFIQNLLIIPISLCWAYARPLFGSEESGGGMGFLYNFGFFDRAGAIPILYSGALSALVGCAVLGPRYGVFMPIENQQQISGGGKEERHKGLTSLLKIEKEKAVEIDELYLYKIRKLIKREMTHGNVESGIDLPKMVVGTFIMTICYCMMNTLGLNQQFDLFT
jgi:ammonia channel protein AmtB